VDFNSTHSISRLYQSFEMIDRSSFQTVVRFFEENSDEIQSLDFDEYFDILVAYVQALFDIGAYTKHVSMADVVIEASIINNVHVYKGINLYEKTLFQKSASLYNLQRYDESIHILSELLKINPFEPNYRAFWIKNKLRKKPGYLQVLQGLSISLFFATMILIGVSGFYIEPFKPEFLELAYALRNILFITGIAFIALADGIHRLSAYIQVSKLIFRSKEKLKMG